jgi:hypothetical protein
MLRTKTSLAVAAAVLVCAAPAAAQTTLRYKFREGEKLDYAIENKMTMKVANLEMGVEQNMDMTWKILSVDSDGKAKISQKLTRIRFSMDTPMGKVVYDSKDGKAPEGPIGQAIEPVFKALAALEYQLTMDARGEISDVKIPEKFLEMMKGPQLPGLGEMFTEEGLKRMMAQSVLPLPKDAVVKGKNWPQKMSFKAPFGEMKMDNTYTYESQVQKGGKRLEHISMKPSLSIEPDPNVPGMKLKSGEGKGAAYFDAEAGRLIEMNMIQNMTLEVAGQSMQMVQNVVMKLKQ